MLKERDALQGSPCSNPGGGGGGLEPAVCGGCRARITDRYYLLAVDRQWHSHCLKCCECKLALDSELTCFARDGNIYCKEDYYRLFAVKRCDRCQAGIAANELVMRARDLVYHLHCFTCASCGSPLAKGDYFGVRDSIVYCRQHYEMLYHHDGTYACADMEAVFHADDHCFVGGGGGGGGGVQKGRPRKRKMPQVEAAQLPVSMRLQASSLGELSSSMESLAYDSSVASPGTLGQQQRNKRMRTSFKHHQLRTMKSYFAINQNPDAKDLKQLATKTQLSKRVLQVWFQNARAKWRRNMMRQENNGGGGGGGGGGNGGPLGLASIGGPPSVGSGSAMMGDSNSSLPPPSQTPDDGVMGQHHGSHGISFADLY